MIRSLTTNRLLLTWTIFLSFVPTMLFAEGEQPPPKDSTVEHNKIRQEDSAIIARYNNREVTGRDIQQELERPEMLMLARRLADKPERAKQLKITALTSIITRNLLLEAAKTSANLKSLDVDSKVDAFVSSQGGKERLIPLLKMHKVTWEKFRDEIGDGIRLKHYVEEEVTKSIVVQDHTIEAAFLKSPTLFDTPEQIRARHILIRTEDVGEEEAKKKAEEILTLYKNGTLTFEALATQYSDDSSTKDTGGDLGYFQKGTMVPEFESVAFRLKDGEVSGPVLTQYGIHIIKLEARTPAVTATLENSKDRIQAALLTEMRANALSKHLEDLQVKAKIEILDSSFRNETVSVGPEKRGS